MSNLSNLDAKNVIIEDGLSEYEKGMEFFYLQLVHLNTTIYIVDQILKFPFELFAEPERTIFFGMVIHNFFDAGLLVITRLATDQGNDLYTLPRFKKRMRELVKSELLSSFDERLRKYRFDRDTTALLEKARQLRNERVGHANEDVLLGISEGARLNFSELKSLAESLNSLLDALSFNQELMMLPIPYDPRVQHPAASNHKSDIEELLDSVAMNSALLNSPEKNPRKWKHLREKLSKAQLGQIKYYRSKFGLPEA